MRPLTVADDLDALLAAPVALLFKHSDRCPISGMAYEQVHAFALRHPDLPLWIVDVIDDRRLSLQAADRLRVRHQSPQVILVVHGRATWDTSHFQVRTETLEQRVGALLDPPIDAAR